VGCSDGIFDRGKDAGWSVVLGLADGSEVVSYCSSVDGKIIADGRVEGKLEGWIDPRFWCKSSITSDIMVRLPWNGALECWLVVGCGDRVVDAYGGYDAIERKYFVDGDKVGRDDVKSTGLVEPEGNTTASSSMPSSLLDKMSDDPMGRPAPPPPFPETISVTSPHLSEARRTPPKTTTAARSDSISEEIHNAFVGGLSWVNEVVIVMVMMNYDEMEVEGGCPTPPPPH
jgi:hypothetical protein